MIKDGGKFQYQLYDWNNLCFFILKKFKIYKRKKKVYEIKHVKRLLKKLNIDFDYFNWNSEDKRIGVNTRKTFIDFDFKDISLFSRIFKFIQKEL